MARKAILKVQMRTSEWESGNSLIDIQLSMKALALFQSSSFSIKVASAYISKSLKPKTTNNVKFKRSKKADVLQ